MSLEAKERIVIPDENGDEHLFEVLATFDVDETEQSYIAVIPIEQKDDEEVEVYAFRYEVKDKDDDDLALFPIDTEEEWEMVEELLETLSDDQIIE